MVLETLWQCAIQIYFYHHHCHYHTTSEQCWLENKSEAKRNLGSLLYYLLQLSTMMCRWLLV